MTVDVFPVPVAALRRRVPASYQLARYPGGRLAAMDVWVLSCRRFPAGARPHRRAALAMIGAVVIDRPSRQALSPKRYRHYLIAAQADDPGVAAFLRRFGLPVETVPGLRSSHAARRRVAEVPSRHSPYRVSSPVSRTEDKPHDHLNVWWHDRRDGRTVGLELRAESARDVYCTARLCGEISVTPSTSLARLLGSSSRRARVSLHHLPLDPALRLLPARRR